MREGRHLDKKLSIIVPVYNQSLFLNKCMTSIDQLNLDHTDIECLFIDDKSTDDSLEQLKAFEQSHDYVRVIELEENTGSPSTPRNVGIDYAVGEYLTFLDADDWLDEEGFPQLLDLALDTKDDIAFGQVLRHNDQTVKKVARFASYADQAHLIPYEIDKIFRAVGPPGKLIKRSVILDHHIQFEHMKYGEDKLFFSEVIAKAKSAAMTEAVVYHVNRFGANDSLVGETDIFEKTTLNLEVLKKILDLDMPHEAKNAIISRIVEMDYLSRLFLNNRFYKNEDKAPFFSMFDDMVQTLKTHGLDINDYLTEPKYEKLCNLLLQDDKQLAIEFIGILLQGEKAPRFESDGDIQFELPPSLQQVAPLKEDIFAHYSGSKQINERFYDVIDIYQNEEVTINEVQLVKLNDESVVKNVSFEIDGNQILIPTNEMNVDFNFNIQLIYDDYKPCLVSMTMPSANTAPPMKRQNFKVEFASKENEPKNRKPQFVDTKKYYDKHPNKVVAVKKFKVYQDAEFKSEVAHKVERGEVFDVADMDYSNKGTPRFVLLDGNIITANRDFTTVIPDEVANDYLLDVPKQVKVLKTCKVYEDRDFKTPIENKLKAGDMLDIQKIVLSSNGTPRLKTESGDYITANRDFVQAL